MAAPTATKLGPGSLTLGTGTILDISCRLSAAKVTWEKDKEDDTEVLCGQTIAGAVTYTAKLTGTVAQDLENAQGIVAYSWAHKGEPVPFEFVPNTAAGKRVTGTVVVDPLDVGGDEVKKNMMSEFEWDCVGEPVLGDLGPPATGATAGTPGTFTPAGAAPPANLAALQAGAVAATPATAWTTGQYMVLADMSEAHWSGAAWASGRAT